MHIFNRRLIAIIMCFVCTAALTACQEGGLFANNDENGESYTLSDEIVIPATRLRSINPVTSIDDDFFQINKLIYSSLIALDDTLVPQPILASSWSFSGGSVRFELNVGIQFSDGSEFDAQDVVFSFNAYKAASDSAYSSKIAHIKSVSAAGSNAVEFTFADPNDISISYFDFPVISSGQFSSVKSCLDSETDIIYGTGQYKIDTVNMMSKITLVPNENYFGQAAQNNITLSIMPVQDPYIGLVKSGALSVYISKSTDREELSGDPDISVTEFTSNEFETLGFNCASDAFADVNLRKAVACMIDRDEIIRAAYYNSGIKSDDLYFPGYYGTETDEPYRKDDDEAYAYLTAAGYSDTDGDGILEDENGRNLSVSLAVNAENVSRVTAADLISENLRNFGIDVNVKQIGSAAYEDAISGGGYDMFIGGWQISDDFDLRKFYHSDYGNYARYQNETLDGYLDSMQSGLSTEEMADTLKTAKAIIKEDVPYICLLYKTYAAATSTDFEGLVAPRFNNYYYACDDWRIRVYNKDEEDGEAANVSANIYE